MAKHQTAPDPKVTGWPSGIKYIIGNEGCERFSYYGMRAILYVYVVGLLMNMREMLTVEAEAEATKAFHFFTAGVYSLPIIGAIVADRLLGKYRTIIVLSIVYCFGHLALALFESPVWQERMFGRVFIDPVQGLYLGLILIAIGSGGIKPCVSAHVGDQFGKGNWHLLQKVFNAFYFIINFGSAFATLLIPAIRGARHAFPMEMPYAVPNLTGTPFPVEMEAIQGVVLYEGSVTWAFGIPGILMGLATIFFWMGRKKFVHVPPTNPGVVGLLDVLSGTSLFMVVGFPLFAHEGVVSLPIMGLGMGISLVLFVVFFSTRQRIKQDDGFLAILFYSLTRQFGRHDPAERPAHPAGKYKDHFFFRPAAERFGEAAVDGPVAVFKIISVFAMVSVFWALFDQHSSTWIKQAEAMNREVSMGVGSWLLLCGTIGAIVGGAFIVTLKRSPGTSLGILGVATAIGASLGYWLSNSGLSELQPSQVPATNPFLVMIFVPYTTFGLYPLMDRLGFKPTPLRRMTLGMYMAALSFVPVALIQHMLDAGKSVHVVWQIIPYIIITLAEVMVSITGLEFAYSQAPKRMKSVIMGFWSLNVAIGNLLVVFIYEMFHNLALVGKFWVFAGLMFAAATLFGLRAAFYKYREFTQ